MTLGAPCDAAAVISAARATGERRITPWCTRQRTGARVIVFTANRIKYASGPGPAPERE